MLTSGAADCFHLVLRHDQAQNWQLVDLLALFDLPGVLRQFALAGFAVRWSMRDDLIRPIYRLQCVSLMPWLPPFSLATLLPWLLLAPQTITGRGLTTVMAIFR